MKHANLAGLRLRVFYGISGFIQLRARHFSKSNFVLNLQIFRIFKIYIQFLIFLYFFSLKGDCQQAK